MNRPSFQFYPADWQSNSNLKRCTYEQKGVWIDVLCLLHDQAEYGVCRWSLKELAQAVGTTAAKLRGLVDKGVLKGADSGAQCEPLMYAPRSGRRVGAEIALIPAQPGPIWYSSRMVVDEHKRLARGASDSAPPMELPLDDRGGLFAGADAGIATPMQPPKTARSTVNEPSPKPRFGDGLGADNGASNDPPPSSCAHADTRAPRADPSSSSSSSIVNVNTALTARPRAAGKPATAVELSIAARSCGVSCQPADPRLQALAENGTSAETLLSAIAAARDAKGGEPVSIGYVVAILERWAKEAKAMKTGHVGASRPQGRQGSARDADRQQTLEGLTGRRANADVIDVDAVVR